jgi:hypothetical protein
VRRTVPPSAEIEERIERLLAVGVGDNPRESLSELARLGARLIIQRAVEGEFDASLGRARYERRPDYQRGLRNYGSGLRNGFHPRRVQTLEGEPEVEIPQVREAAEPFAGGIRLVTAELRTDVTNTRKDGTRGRLRYDYGDQRDPQAAIAWLWKFLDAAKTAGELYGRALVVIAAEQYATRLVVPASQRMPATRWSSQKDIAAKALRKLVGPHLPVSLTKLEQAVKRAHAAYDRAERAARERQRAQAAPDVHGDDEDVAEAA